MKVARHILAHAIAERTLHVQDPQLLAREIAAYLLAERRHGELESILRDVMQYRADHGILEAEIVTAHDVQNHVATEVKKLLQAAYPNARQIRIDTRQNPAIVGGLRIDMANEQLDMSVAAKLATFKRITSA